MATASEVPNHVWKEGASVNFRYLVSTPNNSFGVTV